MTAQNNPVWNWLEHIILTLLPQLNRPKPCPVSCHMDSRSMSIDTDSVKFSSHISDEEADERQLGYRLFQLKQEVRRLTKEGDRLYQELIDLPAVKKVSVHSTPEYKSCYDDRDIKIPALVSRLRSPAVIIERGIIDAENGGDSTACKADVKALPYINRSLAECHISECDPRITVIDNDGSARRRQ